MKTNFKKFALGAVVMGASTLLLAGCGNSSKNESATKDNSSAKVSGNIKLWIDTEQKDTFTKIVKDFEKEYPDVKVDVKVGQSADAKKDVSKDPEKAADVFMLPHDQVGQMAEAGLLYKNTKYADEVKKNNITSAVEGATWKGDLYAYPYGVETQILYYNKSVLSEEDVKSWTGITTKGKMGTNFAEEGANYIFAPLFMSNGDVLFGKSGEDLKGTDFNNEKGIQVLDWIAKQKSNPGVVQSSSATAIAKLTSGETNAFLSGPWSKNDVKKALGDNMGVAAYPTVDFGNGEVPMKAFLGVKLFGVNQQTKHPLAAMALANYITGEKAQLTLFENHGIIPSNKADQEVQEVQDDAVAKAVLAMSDDEHSVVMPKLPEMVSFWPAMDALINDTYKGSIKADQYQAKLDKFVADISKETN
ncbi:MAG TPA: extracellular solute-binding protein [Enterococcus columbae]|nr:extracellular solute-binding protein [Enterococcus columbae]